MAISARGDHSLSATAASRGKTWWWRWPSEPESVGGTHRRRVDGDTQREEGIGYAGVGGEGEGRGKRREGEGRDEDAGAGEGEGG